MPIRKLATLAATVLALLFAQVTYSAPGDVISSLTINNVTGDGRTPTSPQGITYHDGYLYVVDFGTDRIYRVYPEDVLDTDGVTVLFSAGDSDLNLPIKDNDNPPINSDGTPIPTCGAIPAGQYCGGGGLTYALNFLWNASPVTDDIIKIDPVDGDNLESENTLATVAFPSPTDLDYDGTHFWIIDWQSNTINKVLPEDGSVLATIPGPSTLPAYDVNPSVTNARPFGIAWDGQALWVSDHSERKIYRVNPVDGSLLNVFNSPGSNPKGLAWDGEFLWHVDQANQTLYKLESGVIPFGVIGCIEKNGRAVNGEVLLSQTAIPDQSSSTDSGGCFVFPSFVSGNPIQVKVSETGVDEKPIITLAQVGGSTNVTLIVGDSYAEPGFTATDTEDGDITADVIATPDVINAPILINTSVPNTTGIVVAYNVVDSAGNLADTVYRTIYVLEVDVAAPIITLVGANPLYVEQGSSYVEPGATATDDRDGDLSASIVVTGTVNANAAGTYTLSYNVSDLTGNAATTVTRSVIVQDTTRPVITLLGANPITLEKGAAFTNPGATATDNIDGNISGSIVASGTVTVNSVGSYVLTYNVSDAAGNAATTVTRTVNVVDTTIPVITLLGATPYNQELSTPFTDPGATASDVPGENLSASIVVTGSVNTALVGTYTLTYNVTDTAGNAATAVTRSVIVSDTGAPTITLLGDNPLYHELGDVFTDPGATATDAIDGNLTASIVVGGDVVNPNLAGTYNITYNVTDSASNAAATQTRTVIVADTIPPAITLLGSAVVAHELNTSYTDAGATASDNRDGNISASIVIGGNVVNSNLTGTYIITYNVSDAAGNAAAPVTRTVNVADRTRPVITLLGTDPVNHEVGTVYTDAGATATDLIDGNLTSSISVTGTVNANVIGTYTLTYRVSDAAGNAATAVTRTVHVADTGAPAITLLGNSLINHELNTPFTDPGATAYDAADGDLTASIIITGAVNSNITGSYVLTYNVTDSQSNSAPTVTRTVNVADRTAPVITLTGSATLYHEQGTVYTDAGATATDNINGNLTASIVVGGSVNANAGGTYVLTYNVSDTAGNAATQVTRTITVRDTTRPVITLLGAGTIAHEVGTIYVDPGATALDNISGNITASISVTGAVNANVPGTYLLSYNVADAAGNPAITVTRTVTVSDTGAPTITMTGASTLNHELNTPYTDPGASAYDTIDGNLTASIVVNNTVNANVAGTYTVTYNVVDSGGNPAPQQTRTVNVNDFTRPVITVTGSTTVNVELGSGYTDAGATATDNIDGNLTSSIVITGTVNPLVAGTYLINYNVSDAAGNTAIQRTRTVVVSDTTRPVITLLGSATINHQQGTVYSDPGASATDNIDGNISGSITVSGFVNANAAATYVLSYNVSDSAGNNALTVTRTVIVGDSIRPVITLLGSASVNHPQGTPYVDAGATAADNVDGNITAGIVVTGSVNHNAVGVYVLTYNVTDSAGNTALSVTRTVTVADNTAPVITLTGSATVNHQQGTAYTDAGATATDNVDTGLTVNMTGTVNVNTAGTYTLNFNVSDSAGNAATTVTRTVIVADTIAPVLTRIGPATIDHQLGQLYTDPGVTASDNINGNITASIVISGAVNVNAVGTYVLTFNVSDTAGNAATPVTRTVNVIGASTIAIEAETASIGGAHIVSAVNAGFSGSGYIEHVGEGYIEYTFSGFAVPYDLTVRFAWDTGDRPLEVILNGSSLGMLAFPATGSLTTWNTTATFTVTPQSGTNTLRLQTTGSSGTNIDQLTLTPQ